MRVLGALAPPLEIGMSNTLSIRPLRAEDYEAWLPLWRGYQRFYQVTMDEATINGTWRRYLLPDHAMRGWLAWDGDRAVGLVHIVLHPSSWTLGDYCYLQDLFVAEDCRGLGAGRQLIEWVYEWASKRECSRVYWLTHDTNATARRLYDQLAENLGYIQYRKQLTPI